MRMKRPYVAYRSGPRTAFSSLFGGSGTFPGRYENTSALPPSTPTDSKCGKSIGVVATPKSGMRLASMYSRNGLKPGKSRSRPLRGPSRAGFTVARNGSSASCETSAQLCAETFPHTSSAAIARANSAGLFLSIAI